MPRTRPRAPRETWEGRCLTCGHAYSEHPILPTGTDITVLKPLGPMDWNGARGRYDNPRRQDQGFHWFAGNIRRGNAGPTIGHPRRPSPPYQPQPPTAGWEPTSAGTPCRFCGASWAQHEVESAAGRKGVRRGHRIDAEGRPQDGGFHWYEPNLEQRLQEDRGSTRSGWALDEIKAALQSVLDDARPGVRVADYAEVVERLVEVVELERADAARTARQDAAVARATQVGRSLLAHPELEPLLQRVDEVIAGVKTVNAELTRANHALDMLRFPGRSVPGSPGYQHDLKMAEEQMLRSGLCVACGGRVRPGNSETGGHACWVCDTCGREVPVARANPGRGAQMGPGHAEPMLVGPGGTDYGTKPRGVPAVEIVEGRTTRPARSPVTFEEAQAKRRQRSLKAQLAAKSLSTRLRAQIGRKKR